MEQVIKQLKKLGFNEYEAKSYAALVKLGKTNAYQVSKVSGVPRARIYDILNNLCERGIALTEEIDGSVFYQSISIDKFIEDTTKDFNHTISDIGRYLKQIEQAGDTNESKVATIKNKDAILNMCMQLIEQAKERIVISCWDNLYEELKLALEKRSEEVQIKGISMHVKNPLIGIEVHRNTSYTENPYTKKWFILVVDSKEMLYGPDFLEANMAYYTNDLTHIFLMEDYIWHDVLVNRLVRRSGEDLDAIISKERMDYYGLK